MNTGDSHDRKRYRFADREHEDFMHEFVVDVGSLLPYFNENPHLSPFIPFIPEVADSPYEIWQMFQENKASGQVRLQYWFIKALDLDEKKHGFVLVFETLDGEHKSVKFLVFDGDDWAEQLNRYRAGKLVYARNV